MNPAHLHLVVNHLPILGTLFGILILITGMVLRNPMVKRTALGLLVFSAGFAVLAFTTGEGAEEVVEGLPGISEATIGRHEDLADLFLGASIILGAISLLTFVSDLLSWKPSQALYVLTLAAAVGTMVLAQQTGTSGGEIRHTEIRASVVNGEAGTNGAETGGTTMESGESEGDDD
ncbi:MAG: hypothetical protein IPG32_16480 [Saprospirales bacterium]|nr:hypothetical protein [Saprospirales bacterium]